MCILCQNTCPVNAKISGNFLQEDKQYFYIVFSFTEEFVAHGANVNCLAMGHKTGRVMVTGGEDRKVNLWTAGKPNCIMVLFSKCYIDIIWASVRENLSSGVCEQHRCRPACAFAQSDQRLCCSLIGKSYM